MSLALPATVKSWTNLLSILKSASISPLQELLIVYVASIFVNQQKTLNSYRNNNDYYVKQIAEETEYQQTLMAMKDNINSPEYIEQIAREKLDMYLPDERIYKVYN